MYHKQLSILVVISSLLAANHAHAFAGDVGAALVTFKDGVAQFERDPICRLFDELLEELCGVPMDRE